MEKYIFVTGGVISGLGKGITAASLGRLLKSRGYKITMQKFDPYLNVDPGTMSPIQHGEVFVTDDGTETDLDLGHYERFIDENLNKFSNVTTGKIYETILAKERHGDFNGSTVQVIPHVTNEIKSRFHSCYVKDASGISIIEIGGTIGDIESQPFLEAIRQFKMEVGAENVCLILVSLVPYLKASDELKTKPTQMAVKSLQAMGLQPDVIVCRSEKDLDENVVNKISLFCNVKGDHVLTNVDCDSVYELPLLLENEHFAEVVLETLKLPNKKPDLKIWIDLVDSIHNSKDVLNIALVGKYVSLHDAYISVNEALKAAGWHYSKNVKITYIDSESINEKNVASKLKGCKGLLIPGGFGKRGIEGMIIAINYVRTHSIPFLGLCLGMQTAIIEFSRNCLGFKDANSSEFDSETTHPVISLMPEQGSVTDLGGTMRLGSYPCILQSNSKAAKLYQSNEINERHRHRYEVNNIYRDQLVKNGMSLVGLSPDNRIVEMIEISNHPFFIATQAHPEFKSRPDRPHPLFLGFVKACIDNTNEK